MKKRPNQMGSDLTYCEGMISQVPFKRNTPNHCKMCKAGRFLLYPRDPVKNKGTKAIDCVKPPNNSMIDCLVGHAFPLEKNAAGKRVLYQDASQGSLT